MAVFTINKLKLQRSGIKIDINAGRLSKQGERNIGALKSTVHNFISLRWSCLDSSPKLMAIKIPLRRSYYLTQIFTTYPKQPRRGEIVIAVCTIK